jgi:cell division FtsZ-interacting protein ZapD
MEMMLWNVVLTLFVGIMGWVMNEKFQEINRLGILLNKTREEVARDHMTRQEFRQDMQQIIDRFDRLELKIDRLVNKDRIPS